MKKIITKAVKLIETFQFNWYFFLTQYQILYFCFPICFLLYVFSNAEMPPNRRHFCLIHIISICQLLERHCKQYRFADHYTFTAQRCSVGTTLLDSTFSPSLRCFSDTASGIACENLYVFSCRRSVPCSGTHLLFTLFQFATHGCVMLTRQIKMHFFRFTSKAHFYLSPFASRIQARKKQLQAFLLITAIYILLNFQRYFVSNFIFLLQLFDLF